MAAFEQELLLEVADRDGLAVDVEGGIWIACWESAELSLSSRRNARPPDEAAISVDRLAFGGPDLSQLYVTTAGDSTAMTGGLIRLNPGIAGLPVHKQIVEGLEPWTSSLPARRWLGRGCCDAGVGRLHRRAISR